MRRLEFVGYFLSLIFLLLRSCTKSFSGTARHVSVHVSQSILFLEMLLGILPISIWERPENTNSF